VPADSRATAPFAVVVAIHDSALHLGRLLDSVDRHLSPAPELVVVDTGSRDAGAQLARERGAAVVELESNPGFGAANNVGVARARSDVCVLLNPDVELVDDGIARLAALAAGREALIAPRLVRPDGTIERSAHPVPGRASALLPAAVLPRLLPPRARLRADPWRADRRTRVGWAVAACLAGRSELLRRLGPFDPTAFLFFEDLDLCLRAAELGVPTELEPAVRVVHTGAHSTGPAYGGEPFELLARRRREVVAARLGRRALLLDDLAQGLTFATRTVGRTAIRRDAGRPARQLRALLAARRRAG
jgi:GT2 family glycosyltransferase